MEWYFAVIGKYAVFSGRARRKEFWMFTLINICLLSISLAFADYFPGINVLLVVYELLLFIPYVALHVRRLHDIGRSGWWMLLIFIPFIGAITLMIFSVLEGDEGMNVYGPNPQLNK